MKRIVLFLATNLAVMLVLSVVLNLLGADRFLAAEGLNIGTLLVFSLVVGFTGSIISLLMSKSMAKWSTGAQVIETPTTSDEQWLVGTVRRFAEKAGIGMPEVAVFEGAPNAFATGAFKNSSLVAVSTLIQGVVNTFVVFLSRVVGYVVDRAVFKTERGVGPGYFITVIVSQIVFGILAALIVAWFSRQREFRADAGSAGLMNNPRPMISALRRLGGLEPAELPQSFQAHGIAEGRSKFLGMFSSHPPIAERIAALESRQP
jgi:heat shock protein HtpX